MSTDAEFLADAQSSVDRALAALCAALTQGVTDEQVDEISAMAKRSCASSITAQHTQARARELRFKPAIVDLFAPARKLAVVPAENPDTAGGLPRPYPGFRQAA